MAPGGGRLTHGQGESGHAAGWDTRLNTSEVSVAGITGHAARHSDTHTKRQTHALVRKANKWKIPVQ